MKVSELTQKSKEDLLEQLKEEREKLARFHFDLPAKRVKDTSKIKKTRRNIARILTVFKQKHA